MSEMMMRFDMKMLRELSAAWFDWKCESAERMGKSNLGYPKETAESRYEREGGARSSGGGCRSRVPCGALDNIWRSREVERADHVIRLMPDQMVEVLRAEYLGEVEHSKGRQHRERLKEIVFFWVGVEAGQ